MAEGLTQLYTLLSKYSVHGGSPDTLVASEIEPTANSCMFVNRPDPLGKDISREITIIGNACEMLAIEIAYLLGTVRTRYGMSPSKAGEGGLFASQLIDDASGQMAGLVKETMQSLGWRQRDPS
jgi:hypothetical protein